MAALVVAAAAAAAAGGAAAAAGATVATITTIAEIGWMAGTLLASMLFRQKGPNPADIRIQDSAYGRPIPIIYGMYRVAGNIIWTGQPFIQDAGKGGKGPSKQNVSMSFAVGLCEGPITGVRRIWANGKLVYDVSNPSNFQAISGSNSMLSSFTVYVGDETQLADPTMQAALGVAVTPAHRGLAYVVFNNLDLSQWGNYLPSLSFEVMQGIPIEYILTGQATIAQHPIFPGAATTLSQQMDTTGNAYGFQSGLDASFHSQLVPFKLTPWGTTWLNPPFDIGIAFPVEDCQSYDEQGVLASSGVWYTVNGAAFNTNITTTLGGTNSSAIKRNGVVYVTSYIAFAKNPIYVYVSSANQNYTGDTAASWRLVGVSSTHIYAVGIDPSDATYGNWLCQFDLFGNLVAKLWHDTLIFSSYTVGYCVSDTQLYLNGAGTVKLWNGAALIDTGIPADTSGNMSGFSVQNGYAFFTPYGSGSPSFYAQVPGFEAQTTALSTVVSDLCARAGLSSAQYDVTSLTDTLWGYAITNHSTTRNNLAPLMSTYFFDSCDTDGLIRFVRRGQQPNGAFAWADLGASASIGDAANTNPITEMIAQEVDLPRNLTLTYAELNSDYNPNMQRASRSLTNSNKDLAVQAPIVLASDDALMRAQTMLWAAWVGRKTFKFSTPLGYLAYEPGDVATLNGSSESYVLRLTRCQYDGLGSLVWEAALEEPDIYPTPSYSVQSGAAAGFASQTIDYSGPTVLAVLDVPPLQDTDTTQGIYLAACGMSSTWPGATVDISRDSVTYAQLVNLGKPAVIGYANGALPTFGGGNQPDELSTVSVTLYSGALASVTYANFLAGMSVAYLGGEVIYFRTATQTAANTYTLSGLLRARGGTEWAMTSHVAGETFVLLDRTRLASMPLLLSDIGASMYFETYLDNLFGGTPSTAQKLVPSVARVKPLSPALFVAGHGSAASTADISSSWIRRARVNAQWLDGTDVALDEASESYRLQILNGSTVVRTVTVAGTGDGGAYVYSAANITTDGFSGGNTINFSVAQNSDQGVLGFAATASIVR